MGPKRRPHVDEVVYYYAQGYPVHVDEAVRYHVKVFPVCTTSKGVTVTGRKHVDAWTHFVNSTQ